MGPTVDDLRAAPALDPADESEVVVLPRTALYEFLGQVAMPPVAFCPARKNGLCPAESVDCAPIAERLTRWVREHQL